MRTIIVAAGVLALAASGLTAGQVWHSTFATDYDGVVQFQSAPPSGEDMLAGGVSNGEAMVHVPQLGHRVGGNLYTKAGRALTSQGSWHDLTTSHSALYRFRWTALYEGPQGSIPDEGAYSAVGFVRSGTDWPQQGDMGVLMVNYKRADTGDYLLRPYAMVGAYASGGSAQSYSPFWINLGPDPFSQDFQLVIAYDAVTREQTIGLYNAAGHPIQHAGGGDAVFSQTVAGTNNAQFDYLGWEAYSVETGLDHNITAQDMAVNDLIYFDDPTGAFNALPEPATGLALAVGVALATARRRR